MKKCTWCGKEYADTATACVIDARPLEEVLPPQAAGEAQKPHPDTPPVRISVSWHGTVVGQMTNPQEDMWYLEGQWHAIACSQTEAFLARAAALDPRSCILGSQRGLVVALQDNSDPDAGSITALVIAPPKQTLNVRRVFDAKAVELVKAWEREEL